MSRALFSTNPKINFNDLDELSIRDEVLEFFSGEDFGQQKVNIFVCKKIRRDSVGNPKRCSCWNNVQNEAEVNCPSCGGLGYQHDEIPINGYLSNIENKRLLQDLNYADPIGRTQEVFFVFFTDYEQQLYSSDILLRPAMTNEGYLEVPIVYAEEYKIVNNTDQRLDQNRMEYHSYPCQRTR